MYRLSLRSCRDRAKRRQERPAYPVSEMRGFGSAPESCAMKGADKNLVFAHTAYQVALARSLRVVNLKDGSGTDLQALLPTGYKANLGWVNLFTVKEGETWR